MTGTPESASRVGVSVCDIGAGLNAYGAILEALHGRHRTGRGSGIRVSLFDGMADWMTVPLLHLEHGGKAPARTGLSHAMIAPYGAYPVGDGGQMVIAIQNDREWARFCEAILGDAALTTDPRFAGHPARLQNRPEMDALIVEAFARHDMDTLAEALRGAQIAFGRLNEVSGLSAHPQLRRAPVETSAGTVEIVAPPARHEDGDRPLRPVPALGEQNEAVRREFAGSDVPIKGY